jgi:hypothetical protein
MRNLNAYNAIPIRAANLVMSRIDIRFPSALYASCPSSNSAGELEAGER